MAVGLSFNVYVGKELRREIEARRNVNWSHIAQTAFWAEIKRLRQEEMCTESDYIVPLMCSN